MREHKVHVGYGFHVNCYHSYRGDANDETGFGGDIRIIRKIIVLLDELNEKGIPAKGTWDFENAYSLEDILPRYAPDIIEGVRQRVIKYGDENIIMGYNNGALSAMTEDEFLTSIEWAVTNERGSGLRDIFGECEMIVRPQEVMFTPSQARLYNKAGVKAVCLYYSCVPFDAFRTIIPQLPDEYAFNPLSYTYKCDSVVILPTYCNTDIIDAGSLRYLAMDLHERQKRSEINNDVFIFINMDADAIFWEPLGLPFPANKMANTMGIKGLVEEVADLDFVVFDTPGNYLKTHEPLTEITFNQDTADGTFTGYYSWAEKPFNRQIWTRLERARTLARFSGGDKNSSSFYERVMLLSTTHFGLASPVLNIDRERAALALSQNAVEKELQARQKRDELTLLTDGKSRLVSAQLRLKKGCFEDVTAMNFVSEGLESFAAAPMGRYDDGSIESVFLICNYLTPRKEYQIKITTETTQKSIFINNIKTESLRWKFCEHGNTLSLTYKGRQIGGKDFIRSYITYDNNMYQFSNQKAGPLPLGGSAQGIRVTSEIHLPEELEAGFAEFAVFALRGLDCIFIKMHIKYPYTPEETEISTQASALGRKSDVRWLEAVPMQLMPMLGNNISVIKRNFMDDISSYRVDSFGEYFPQNNTLDSFNNHLTNGMVGLSDGETGIVLANAVQVLNSMAYCPMRLRRRQGRAVVSMNPFGSYYGKQRFHPSRSNGAVWDAFPVIAAQARPLAPAYNGAEETAMLALFAYEGAEPNEKTLCDIRAFADGAAVLDAGEVDAAFFDGDNVNFKAVQVNELDPKKLKSVIASGVTPGKLKTVHIASRALGNIIKSQLKARVTKHYTEKTEKS